MIGLENWKKYFLKDSHSISKNIELTIPTLPAFLALAFSL